MAKLSIKGQTALVTGAGQRLGRAISHALADEGVNIIAHYNTSCEEALALVSELEAKGVKSWAFKADFNEASERDSLVDQALSVAGSFQILINNASIFPADELDDVTLSSLTRSIEINAWTPFTLSRDFKQKIGRGVIINLEDTRIAGFDWKHVGYIISKHALAAFTRMMAIKYAPDIRVNAVRPGLILPPPGKDVSYIERLADLLPLKKHGAAEDIAETIVFLVKSDFITGEVIYVDGGRHLKEYPDDATGPTS